MLHEPRQLLSGLSFDVNHAEELKSAPLAGRRQWNSTNRAPGRKATCVPSANLSPTLAATALKELHARDQLTPRQADVFLQPRPGEELYHLRSDPRQEHNLAARSSPPAELGRLRSVLERWTRETGDTVPSKPTATNVEFATGKRGEVVRGEPPGAAAHALQINAPGPIRAN